MCVMIVLMLIGSFSIVFRVLYIPGDAGFLPSTVCHDMSVVSNVDFPGRFLKRTATKKSNKNTRTCYPIKSTLSFWLVAKTTIGGDNSKTTK